MSSVLRTALTDALALALPVACCACGAPGADVCPLCRTALAPDVRSRMLEADLRVFWALDYADAVVPVVRALKEDGRTGIARLLAPALRAAVDDARATEPGVRIVPVPTSSAAMRRRGFRVVDLLLRRAGVPVDRVLVPVRGVRDQRGLDRAERAENTRLSLAARHPVGAAVIVVDDVVTTGATLREAARALQHAGARVAAAVALASTPLRTASPESRT